jgi:UDP-glucose 4-epimerase
MDMGGVVLIGGPGTISSSCVDDLLQKEIRVSIFTRSLRRDDEGVAGRCRVILGDRMDQNALAEAMGSVRPDAVVDFCCFRRVAAILSRVGV